MTVWSFLNNAATLLGVVVAIYTFGIFVRAQYLKFTHTITWRHVERAVKSLTAEIKEAAFVPDAIFSMGRGGMVMAAMMSARIRQDGRYVPVFMVDRVLEHTPEGRVSTIQTNHLDIKQPHRRVLLVGGINPAGESVQLYRQWLVDRGVSEVKTCVIVESKSARNTADFVHKRYALNPSQFKMPWYEGPKDWANMRET